MATLFSDAFTYADGALATVSSGVWADVVNALRVGSNKVIEKTSGGEGFAKVASFSATGDQWAQCVVAGSAMQYQGPCVRFDGSGHCYLLEVNGVGGPDSRIVYYNGSFNQLAASTGAGFSAGDTAYLDIQGTTLIAKKNGVTIITTSDSNIASGNPGIRLFGTGSADRTIDDFAAGDFSSGGAVIPVFMNQYRQRRN